MKKRIVILLMVLVLLSTLCLTACTLQGQSAYELAVEYGFEGTEEEWLESLKGDVTTYNSAYDVALECGFEGTEEEWLLSLVGDTGGVDVTITDSSTNTAYTVSEALSSTVSIVCTVTSSSNTTSYSMGTGVVYQMDDTYSYIITNYHVIYDEYETSSKNSTVDNIANTISIYPYGSSSAISATFIGGSIDEDIAILAVSTTKLSACNMTAVTIGDAVITGQSIYVVGNALGEGISATSGIVSVYRTSIDISAIDNDSETNSISCIQVDAAVNSGNSGGGLFDTEGNLVGIVNAKYVDDGVEGMGYAIPVSVAEPIAVKIIDAFEQAGYTGTASATRQIIGVSVIATSSVSAYDEQGLLYVKQTCQVYGEINTTTGLGSGGVTSGSLADQAGIKSGDTLVSATLTSKWLGEVTIEITQSYQLTELIYWAEVGDTLELTVLRGGVEVTCTITFDGSSTSTI